MFERTVNFCNFLFGSMSNSKIECFQLDDFYYTTCGTKDDYKELQII